MKALINYFPFSYPAEVPTPFLFFIISKNSENSMLPFPSSSMAFNIFSTSSLEFAIPNDIKGSSSSSEEMLPVPFEFNELK